MGGAQSPWEQSPGMGVLNGGKHAYQGAKLCMHACMYEDKGHKGHVPCEKGPKATPQKQVKHGTLPPQGKMRLISSLSYFPNGSPHPLSLALPQMAKLSQKRPRPLPPLFNAKSAFLLPLPSNNQEKKNDLHLGIFWLAHFTYMRWPTIMSSYITLTRGPPPLEPSYARWEEAQYPLDSHSNLSLSLCSLISIYHHYPTPSTFQ